RLADLRAGRVEEVEAAQVVEAVDADFEAVAPRRSAGRDRHGVAGRQLGAGGPAAGELEGAVARAPVLAPPGEAVRVAQAHPDAEVAGRPALDPPAQRQRQLVAGWPGASVEADAEQGQLLADAHAARQRVEGERSEGRPSRQLVERDADLA